MPAYANKIMEFGMSVLNDKLKKRVMVSYSFCSFQRRRFRLTIELSIPLQFYKNLDELKGKVSPALLPKEYGGTVPIDDMITKFKARLRKQRAAILALDDMYIEITKESTNFAGSDDADIDAGVVGSFRKLEVD